MENTTLLTLLEADKELIMGSLRADRSPQGAQTALEKALDRVALRYAEGGSGGAAAEAAQLMLKSFKSGLPMLDAVSEVRRWEKNPILNTARRKWKPVTLGLMALGVVLILSVMLGLLFTGGRILGVMTFVEAVIPAALGMAALFYAGLRAGKPERPTSPVAEVRDEFLIDPEKVWHDLRGMLLLADNALEGVEARTAREMKGQIDTTGTKLDARQIELFAGLLENAYSREDEGSREIVEDIRFYLHHAGIGAIDYEPGRENCFEFLPAPAPGTMRPALMAGEKVVKKGLASR